MDIKEEMTNHLQERRKHLGEIFDCIQQMYLKALQEGNKTMIEICEKDKERLCCYISEIRLMEEIIFKSQTNMCSRNI